MPVTRKKERLEESEPTPQELFSAVFVAVTPSLPGIPLELKLLILEILALESQASLATVCQLSREWESIAVPVLYETVMISSWYHCSLEKLAKTVHSGSRPASFYKKTVKTICVVALIHDSDQLLALHTVLAACCDITTLAVQSSVYYSVATAIARHCTKLQKLCIPRGSLLDSESIGLNSSMVALFKKTQITHLQVTVDCEQPYPKIDMGSLPLTHLHIRLTIDLNLCRPNAILNMLHQSFTLPQSVKCCIISAPMSTYPIFSKDAVASAYATHPTLVFMAANTYYGSHCVVPEWFIPDLVPNFRVTDENWAQDWTNRGGKAENLWEIAERLITARRVQKAAGSESV